MPRAAIPISGMETATDLITSRNLLPVYLYEKYTLIK